MRMKVDALTPNELWSTSVEDLDLATTVQAAYHHGIREVKREREEAARKEREREQKQRESQQRMQEKYGR